MKLNSAVVLARGIATSEQRVVSVEYVSESFLDGAISPGEVLNYFR